MKKEILYVLIGAKAVDQWLSNTFDETTFLSIHKFDFDNSDLKHAFHKGMYELERNARLKEPIYCVLSEEDANKLEQHIDEN